MSVVPWGYKSVLYNITCITCIILRVLRAKVNILYLLRLENIMNLFWSFWISFNALFFFLIKRLVGITKNVRCILLSRCIIFLSKVRKHVYLEMFFHANIIRLYTGTNVLYYYRLNTVRQRMIYVLYVLLIRLLWISASDQ